MRIAEKIYDGKLIHKRFAYRICKEYGKSLTPYGTLAWFTAPMQVEEEGMIDEEDIINRDFIYSEFAMNFVWEIPHLTPIGAVFFQLLFNTKVASLIPETEMKGDDIMRGSEKLSVSITKCTDGVALGHTAINIHAGLKAPYFAGNIPKADALQIAKTMDDWFTETTHDASGATWKV